jgi:UrcA family protein
MKLKKHISSLLFAMAMFGGMGHAQSAETVKTTITYDPAMLENDGGIQSVMRDIRRQSVKACREVSLISVGFSVDKACARSVLEQAVTKIGSPALRNSIADVNFDEADL